MSELMAMTASAILAAFVCARSAASSADCIAFFAFKSASSDFSFASIAVVSSVGGAVSFPTSHADPPETLTWTLSPGSE